jgi:ureidoglycolate hydrolase
LFDAISTNYAIGLARISKHSLPQRICERHLRTPECLVPVGGDIGIIVGPPNDLDEPARLPEARRFRAFKVREGQGVLLKPGVWHGVPYPLERTTSVFVVFASGTGQRDHVEAQFPDGAFLELEL